MPVASIQFEVLQELVLSTVSKDIWWIRLMVRADDAAERPAI